MNEKEFKINASGAETFRRNSNPPETSFWEGYRRGLRRHYHGEIFGTDEEHAQWIKLLTNKTSDRHRYLGLGYHSGFDGTNVTEALNQFERTDARSLTMAAFKSACS